jgi:sortase A
MKLVERALLLGAVVLLGWAALVTVQAAVVQRRGDRQLDAMLAGSISPPFVSTFEARRPGQGELLGRIEIPRVGMRAVVHEGIDKRTLLRAVGHIPGTAFPGSTGTIGLAAHRDSYFRPLKDVRVGDELFVTTPHGRIRYVIRDTQIVRPEDTWVLRPTTHESVALVTCYPFSYIGLAPERFVVRADREDRPARPPAIDAREGKASVTLAGSRGGGDSIRKAARKPGKVSAGASRQASPDMKRQKKPASSKRGFWKKLASIFT